MAKAKLAKPQKTALDNLLAEIRACMACAAHLPFDPNPVVHLGPKARLMIIGQAPGTRVHKTGIPWNDPSGDNLRNWLSLDRETFYDTNHIAIMPMGFCYPGKGTSGDLPPRPECAPLWHDRVMEMLKARRLTLLVGSYAQASYLGKAGKKQTLTDAVKDFKSHGPEFFPLPHPSWRSGIWMKRNLWFESRVLPALRALVGKALAD